MIRENLHLAIQNLNSSPRRTLIILACALVAGLFEGLSIAVTLPVFEIVISGDIENSESRITNFIRLILDSIGLQMSIYSICSILFLFIFMKSIISFFSMNVIGWVIADLSNEMRKTFILKTLGAKWLEIKKNKTGASLNTLNYEIPKSASIYRYSCEIITTLFQILILFYLSVTVSLIASVGGILMGVGIFIALSFFVTLSRNQSIKQVHFMNSFLSNLNELIQGLKVIKAMNLKKGIKSLLFDESNAINQATRKQVLAKHGITYFQEPIIMLFLSIGIVLLTTQLSIPGSEILLILLIFIRLSQSIGRLQSHYQTFVTNAPYYISYQKKISTLSSNEEKISDSISSLNKINHKKEINIDLIDIHFSFGKNELFRGASYSFPTKGFVAISGPSGSGKSTLMDMLLGLVEVDSGLILINGININDYDLGSLRSKFGYVPQESFIFNDTFLNNIIIGDKDISSKSVDNAIINSGCDEFIKNLEKGRDSILLEGGGLLSGGQKQRLAIARALAREPKVLFLDEFTSALDSVNKNSILKVIQKISKDVLVISITHDPDVVIAADIELIIANKNLSLNEK